MELKDARFLFESGSLVSAAITKVPMLTTYHLTVKTQKGKEYPLAGQRSKAHEAREFKTIDAAVANAKKIGFKNVTVILD